MKTARPGESLKRPVSASSKNPRDFYKTLCTKLKVPMCPAILERCFSGSLASDEIEMNLDDLNNDQQAALPRILKFFRLKGLKLWSTGYEVIEYSKFGMRKGRGKTDEKKTSEVPGMLSAVLSCFFESITSKRMTVFALFGLKLAPKTWAQFANGLAASQISTVCVNHCEVTDKEFETLFQALGMMAKLNVLDLAHNKITDGYLVARVISRQGERRDVSKWEGGLRGSVASIPEGLSELYLSDNLLADIGWEKIMSSLISDNWLRLIDCKRNNISNRSLKQTLKVMKENKSLLVVDLRFNINFERGFLKVMEIIDRNFDSIEKGTETCNHFTQLFELIVNELEFPSVCQVRFVRNAVKKLKIKSPLENLDRKLNSVAGRYTSVELIKEKPKKKGWSVMRNSNMEERTWQQLYLYGKDYEAFLRNFIDQKKRTGEILNAADFSSIDIIRPSKNEVVGEFIQRFHLGDQLDCLDVGSGIGGFCRYLASLGHNATGYDILPHYVQIGLEINSLIKVSGSINLVSGDIMNSEVPESSFDLITCLGFLMYVPGAEILKKLSSLLRPGGVMFIEDYIRLKESPNESETRSLNGFHCIQIRTRKEFDQHLSEAGLEVFEFIDKGRQTSEFAWNRAENFLIRYNLGECKADEIEIYADYCPRILNSVDHLGRETILERFPNLCQKIGTEPGLTADKLLTWVSLAVRKARD